MEATTDLQFEFEFGSASREALLDEARRTVAGLTAHLGDETASDTASVAAGNLLLQLNQEVAEFGSAPDVIRLNEEHFTEHGLAVPARFRDLSTDYRFYWMRLPINLQPLEHLPFNKLECAVEFNPDDGPGQARPRARMILPDRKFQQLLEVNDGLELRIGENLEFETSTGSLSAAAGSFKAKGTAAVDAKAAGKLGFVAGPFTYRVKKALVEHSPAGLEKIFWRLSGAEFFQEDDPTLVVVLQVPNAVKQVRAAAALQAYHRFNLGAAGLSDAINYFRQALATFFRKGAPKRHTTVWTFETGD